MVGLAWYERHAKELEERRKEREKQKKEKAIAKKRAKSKERLRKRRVKYNKEYYKKRRKKILDEKKSNNDEYGIFYIILTENRKKCKNVKKGYWSNSIMELYDTMIRENHSNVSYPRKYIKENGKLKPVHKELLLIKKLYDDTKPSTKIRDRFGLFIEYAIENRTDYTILSVNDWYEEEMFEVYTKNSTPIKMTYKEILEQLIYSDLSVLNTKNIFVHKNLLLIQHLECISTIVCYNTLECHRLYDTLYKDLKKEKLIIFTGTINKNNLQWLYQSVTDQTGWLPYKIKQLTTTNKINKPFNFKRYITRLKNKFKFKHIGDETGTYYFNINDNLIRISKSRSNPEQVLNIINTESQLKSENIYSFVFETEEPTISENLEQEKNTNNGKCINEYIFTIWQKGRNFTNTDYKRFVSDLTRLMKTNIFRDTTKKTDFTVKNC